MYWLFSTKMNKTQIKSTIIQQEFLNNFQTAQQAIIDASSQAADAARANVQSAYTNSTKLALKVRFAAPIIIVPENSRSRNSVLVDLGRMTLNNQFVDLNVHVSISIIFKTRVNGLFLARHAPSSTASSLNT